MGKQRVRTYYRGQHLKHRINDKRNRYRQSTMTLYQPCISTNHDSLSTVDLFPKKFCGLWMDFLIAEINRSKVIIQIDTESNSFAQTSCCTTKCGIAVVRQTTPLRFLVENAIGTRVKSSTDDYIFTMWGNMKIVQIEYIFSFNLDGDIRMRTITSEGIGYII